MPGTQLNLYSTGFRLGFASGKTQILGFASGKTRRVKRRKGFTLAPRYQHVGIPNTKFWRRGHCSKPTPNARYFASQRNIVSSVTKLSVTRKWEAPKWETPEVDQSWIMIYISRHLPCIKLTGTYPATQLVDETRPTDTCLRRITFCKASPLK